MSTIFTKIINGELPGRIVYSDDRVAAFLTIQPLTAGHTLVVPRAEVDEWTDLEPALAGHVLSVAHTIGGALKRAYRAPRVGLVIAGFEVPHAHVHVFTAEAMSDFDFARAGAMSDEELDTHQQRVIAALANQGQDQD
ncbi:HIT family protein [Actinoplanes sp. G11-F43]|uniref:HIT family protein n=1 Tax=Actinoplanes sp. G11-F43 TaxID=3424130 RepID=UPI003D325597